MRLNAFRAVRFFTDGWPDDYADDELLVLESDDLGNYVMFMCPCGCAEPDCISIDPRKRHHWDLTKETDGTITLSPSLLRNTPCRSHFFIRHNRVEWC